MSYLLWICIIATIKYIGKGTMNNYFKNEKHVEEFICNNINSFCKDILNDTCVSYKEQYKYGIKSSNKEQFKRIDIYIECENKNYIVEVKNPKSKSDNVSAIGQLLDYGRLLNNNNKITDLIMITTLHDINTFETIKHYQLPIRYMTISENELIEYKRE